MVGKEIQQTRRRAGLTQAELASRMEVSSAYIAGIETGKENLTIGQLANIANSLGTALNITFPEVDKEYLTLRPLNLDGVAPTS